jgi:hypothetical protein
MSKAEYSSQGRGTEVHRKSPMRLRLALGVDKRVSTRDLRVSGQEYLEQLRPGNKVIVATTHISDMDVPFAAYALRRSLNLAITEMSIHRDLSYSLRAGDPSFLGTLIAGRKNFLTVTYPTPERGDLTIQDLANVGIALDKGKAVVIAAHNRPGKEQINRQLDSHPGYFAVLSAYLSGALVLPVAVQIGEPTDAYGTDTIDHWKELVKVRPPVQVTIGSPLQFNPPDGVKEAATVRELLHVSRGNLRRDRETLMVALADLLPGEKRGIWDRPEQP